MTYLLIPLDEYAKKIVEMKEKSLKGATNEEKSAYQTAIITLDEHIHSIAEYYTKNKKQ